MKNVPEPVDLSIVTTMYKSETFILEFCARASAAAEAITPNFEIILVNDGSPDASGDVARSLCTEDPRIVLIDLSRNFGHHAAILAGLDAARGRHVYLTDSDLEEQPEWLLQFWEKAVEGSHDVVYGIQKSRMGKGLDNLLGQGFWWLLNTSSSVAIPRNQMTCRLMSRDYLDSFLDVRDKVIYLGGLFPWVGYEQEPIYLVKSPRPNSSKSTYGVFRKLQQLVDSMTSFTAAPLTMFFMLGVLIWLGSLLYGALLVAYSILYPNVVLSGFTSLMFSIWFLGGLIILGIGTVGQYVAKIFQEVKDRPRYVVRSVTRREQ